MTAASTWYDSPFGAFSLHRYPTRRGDSLQAWCSADSLLLDAAKQSALDAHSTLIVNDEQGALCVSLQPRGLWTDSALAAIATRENLERNHRTLVDVTWSTDKPAPVYKAALVRVPKQRLYFEYQLATLAQLLPEGATVFAAGMDKHLSPLTATLLERYIGPTERHRGIHRARLFHAVRRQGDCPPPPVGGRYFCEEVGEELISLPNVFSHDGLDMGSRFLLQNLPALDATDAVIDLACGNGVLGLAAYKSGLAGRVAFCDESAMAIASARMNCARVYPAETEAFSHFLGDGLSACSGEPARLILCNPPFHNQHIVDDFVGRRLLIQCGNYLKNSGRLCLVANRHLDYAPTLRQLFSKVHPLAKNRKFIVWLASIR